MKFEQKQQFCNDDISGLIFFPISSKNKTFDQKQHLCLHLTMSLLFPTLSSQFIQSKDATTAITNFESNSNRQKVSATLTFGDDSNATVRPPRRRFGKKTRVRTFDNLRCILRYLFHFCFSLTFCLFLSLSSISAPLYLSLFLQLPSISCTSVCIFQSLSLSLSLSSLAPLCLFNLFLPLLYLLSPLSLSSSASSFF